MRVRIGKISWVLCDGEDSWKQNPVCKMETIQGSQHFCCQTLERRAPTGLGSIYSSVCLYGIFLITSFDKCFCFDCFPCFFKETKQSMMISISHLKATPIIRITDFGDILVKEDGGLKIKFTARETCVLCTSFVSYNRIQ